MAAEAYYYIENAFFLNAVTLQAAKSNLIPVALLTLEAETPCYVTSLAVEPDLGSNFFLSFKEYTGEQLDALLSDTRTYLIANGKGTANLGEAPDPSERKVMERTPEELLILEAKKDEKAKKQALKDISEENNRKEKETKKNKKEAKKEKTAEEQKTETGTVVKAETGVEKTETGTDVIFTPDPDQLPGTVTPQTEPQ